MTNMLTRFLVVAGAAALAAGCAGAWNGAEDGLSVAEEHPIAVDSQVVTMTLPLSGSAELSSLDKARLVAPSTTDRIEREDYSENMSFRDYFHEPPSSRKSTSPFIRLYG